MAACDFGGAMQPAWRLRNHSRRALHQRFEDERGVGIAFFLLRDEFLFEFIDAFPIALAILARIGPLRLRAIERTAITIWRRYFVRPEQQAGVAFVEQIDVSERDGADGVAVIGAVE